MEPAEAGEGRCQVHQGKLGQPRTRATCVLRRVRSCVRGGVGTGHIGHVGHVGHGYDLYSEGEEAMGRILGGGVT